MDELLMNLFSLIARRVRSKQELFDDEAGIMQALLNDGYHLHEADAAITLMQTLVQKQAETFFGADTANHAGGIRTMNSEERRRFAPEAFAFALKLTHLGVLSEEQREDILERAMTLYREQIGLDHVKTLVAFLLFAGIRDRDEAALSPDTRIRHTAWN